MIASLAGLLRQVLETVGTTACPQRKGNGTIFFEVLNQSQADKKNTLSDSDSLK